MAREDELNELDWMNLWGVKAGPRRLKWAGRRVPPYKPSTWGPGPLDVDGMTLEEVAECIPLTARPTRIAWWKRIF